ELRFEARVVRVEDAAGPGEPAGVAALRARGAALHVAEEAGVGVVVVGEDSVVQLGGAGEVALRAGFVAFGVGEARACDEGRVDGDGAVERGGDGVVVVLGRASGRAGRGPGSSWARPSPGTRRALCR